jgi:hypothetical protein
MANGQTIFSGSIRPSSGLADEVQRLPPRVRYPCCAMYGACEGNRTLDIQLGKLGVCHCLQYVTCKTEQKWPYKHQGLRPVCKTGTAHNRGSGRSLTPQPSDLHVVSKDGDYRLGKLSFASANTSGTRPEGRSWMPFTPSSIPGVGTQESSFRKRHGAVMAA